MRPLFACLMLVWTLVASYHLSRFALRRRFVSLVVAVYPLGWGLFALREMRLLPNWGAVPFMALSLVVGVFVVGAILAHELRRARPFR